VQSVSELNKRQVRLFVEDVWNAGRLDRIAEFVAADYLGHFSWSPDGVLGPHGLHRLVVAGRQAHPGLYVKMDAQIAEDDLVVTRWRAVDEAGRGCSGISVVRLLAGKLVDSQTTVTADTPDVVA
jgi:predicted SnoaL-like aldol condensation-catalyzing enzyme